MREGVMVSQVYRSSSPQSGDPEPQDVAETMTELLAQGVWVPACAGTTPVVSAYTRIGIKT